MENQKMQSDEQKVRMLYLRLLESWNENDADAFADLFTADGNVTGFDGSQMNGQPEIRKELSRIFADHKVSTYVGIVREVRRLNENVFILRAVGGMLPPGKEEINPKVNAIQNMVAVKDGEGFCIVLYQNTPATFHERPELSKELTEELQRVADNELVVQ
jgi:uncharacterized protein (TIGR02246 family)